MKHYYTIETFEGIILADATTKAEAIKTARLTALNYRQSVQVAKIAKDGNEFIDYVAIIEFPVWLRNFSREKLNTSDTKVVNL